MHRKPAAPVNRENYSGELPLAVWEVFWHFPLYPMGRFPTIRLVLCVSLLVLFQQALPVAGQTFLFSRFDHSFRVIGISSNGTIVVLSSLSHELSFIYEFNGTNADITPLLHLQWTHDADDARMSRDGEWVSAEIEVDDVDIGTLWQRSSPTNVVVASLPPGFQGITIDVGSTPSGPIVASSNYETSFLWTPGQTPIGWVTNQSEFYVSLLSLQRMSQDGKIIVGSEIFIKRQGDAVHSRAVMATRDSYAYLGPRGSRESDAYAISPNGRFIAGHINLRAVMWQDGKMKKLPFGSRSISIADTVTDNGFVGGRGAEGQMIYDPRSRKGYAFADWWNKHYPQTPFPWRVRRIYDLYEHGGNLYCAVDVRDDEVGESYSIIAIAPIKGLPLTKLTNPPGGYNRLGRIPGWRVTR